MQGFLERLATEQVNTQEELKKLNRNFDTFYKSYTSDQKKEEQRAKKLERDKKRGSADRDLGLKGIFKQEKARNKKGWLGDLLGMGLKGLSGLALLKGLGLTAIGAAITAYIKSPEFRNFIKEKIIEPIGSMIHEFTKNFVDKVEEQLDSGLDEATKALPPSLRNRARRKAPSKGQDVTGRDVDRLKILTGEIVKKGGLKGKEQAVAVAASEQAEKLGDKIDELYKLTSHRDKWIDLLETRTDLVKKLEKEDPDNVGAIKNAKLRQQEAQKKVKAFDAQIKKDEQIAKTLLTIQYKFEGKTFTDTDLLVKLINDDRKFLADAYKRPYKPLKRQQGGPITVPGVGSGDKVPMALPPGSFVLNRNASQYLQTGGMVNTMLEPGETVFPPGDSDKTVKELNQKYSRHSQGTRKNNGAPTEAMQGEGGYDFLTLQKGGKVFLHWAGTPHTGYASPRYHATIMKDGTPKKTLDYNDFKSGKHTSGFNSQGVGISLDAMGKFNGRWPDHGNYGPYAVKPAQYEGMAKLTASILKSWGYGKDYVTKGTVMTHAEAANIGDAQGTYGPLGPPPNSNDYRWDLWGLYEKDKPGSGGDKIRAMIRQAMTGEKVETKKSSKNLYDVTDVNKDGKVDVVDLNQMFDKKKAKVGDIARLPNDEYRRFMGLGWEKYTPQKGETFTDVKEPQKQKEYNGNTIVESDSTNTSSSSTTTDTSSTTTNTSSDSKNKFGIFGELWEAFKEGFQSNMDPGGLASLIAPMFGIDVGAGSTTTTTTTDVEPVLSAIDSKLTGTSDGTLKNEVDSVLNQLDSALTGNKSKSSDSAKSNNPYDIAKSIGFSRKDWDIYRNVVGLIESGNRWNPSNDKGGGSGGKYDGRWQLGWMAKTDAAQYLGEKYVGHEKGNPGGAARRKFRRDPDMQERYFAAFTAKNHQYLTGHPKYDAMSVREKFEILGYAHNQGAGGARKWLNTGVVGKDGFGTKADKYAKKLRAAYQQQKLQKGGMVNTLLEPGEKVFMPGQWDSSIQALNDNVPRFQTGGAVGMRGGDPNHRMKGMNHSASGMMQPIIINAGGGGGVTTMPDNSQATPTVPTLAANTSHSFAMSLVMLKDQLSSRIG